MIKITTVALITVDGSYWKNETKLLNCTKVKFARNVLWRKEFFFLKLKRIERRIASLLIEKKKKKNLKLDNIFFSFVVLLCTHMKYLEELFKWKDHLINGEFCGFFFFFKFCLLYWIVCIIFAYKSIVV